MENYRINFNYAKALFLVASDTGQLDAVSGDMRLVADTCREHLVPVQLVLCRRLSEEKNTTFHFM